MAARDQVTVEPKDSSLVAIREPPREAIETGKKSTFRYFVQPDQDEAEKLNRFQAVLSGASTGMPPPEFLDLVEDRTKSSDLNKRLHGPLFGKNATMDEKKAVWEMLVPHVRAGKPHKLWERFQQDAAAKDPDLADNPMAINFVVPRLMASDESPPFLTYVAMISDPEDAARIARMNVKKSPNFTPFLFQSLIATTDNDHWAKQRQQLNEVFLPKASLSKIFPISLNRAEQCATRLHKLVQEDEKYGVEMHEFFLHEAQAQLQLALFGMDEKFMESTNKNIRDVFNGTQEDPNYGKDMCLSMLNKVGENPAFAAASNKEVMDGSKPIFGPLSKSVADAGSNLDMNLYDQFGNMMLVLFAGHDTTAHTMTWFTYEMAKNQELQKKLQAEIDAMFESLGGRPMQYEDCEKLPFMSRCVMETLRMWTAVPNGTFRELQYEEEVKGPGGKRAILPKGTHVQIVNWTRHRNPKLWGPDADVFNPHRDFKNSEIWDGFAFKGFTPQSERFSPFTFTPRDCLGKNFAQMEMRTILSNVFRHFTFKLSEPYENHDPALDGPIENVGATMGPRDLTPEGKAATQKRLQSGRGPKMAMYLKAIPRQINTPASSKL